MRAELRHRMAALTAFSVLLIAGTGLAVRTPVGTAPAAAGADRIVDTPDRNTDPLRPARSSAPPSVAPRPLQAPARRTSILDDPAVERIEVGWYPSIAYGPDGRALIAYRDESNQSLKVAHCNDAVCTSATTSVVDTTFDAGYHNALTIAGDGRGLMVYTGGSEWSGKPLRAAHCENASCTTSRVSTLWEMSVQHLSIATGADGRGVFALAAQTRMLIGRCRDVACTSAAFTEVLAKKSYVRDTATVVREDGRPLIAFTNHPSLHHARLGIVDCADVECSESTVSTIEAVGFPDQIAMATSRSGDPSIVWVDAEARSLRLTTCLDDTCRRSATTRVDDGRRSDSGGRDPSIAIDHRDRVVISYIGGAAQALMVASCQRSACLAPHRELADERHAREFTSIAVARDGRCLVGYFGTEQPTRRQDTVGGDLRLYRC